MKDQVTSIEQSEAADQVGSARAEGQYGMDYGVFLR